MPKALPPYNKRPVTVAMTMPDHDTVTLKVTSPAGTAEVTATRVGYGEEAEAVVWNYENPPLFFSLEKDAVAYLDGGHPGTLERLDRFVPIQWQLSGSDACVDDLAVLVDYARRVLLNEK